MSSNLLSTCHFSPLTLPFPLLFFIFLLSPCLSIIILFCLLFSPLLIPHFSSYCILPQRRTMISFMHALGKCLWLFGVMREAGAAPPGSQAARQSGDPRTWRVRGRQEWNEIERKGSFWMSPSNPTLFIASSFRHPVPSSVARISLSLLLSHLLPLTFLPYLQVKAFLLPRSDTFTFVNVPETAEWDMRVIVWIYR